MRVYQEGEDIVFTVQDNGVGMSQELVDSLLNRTATDRTGIGPKSPKELEATLAETQRTGFAEEHGDVTPGFDSYAVAVRDYNDFPIAGLALTFVSGSLRPEQERSLKTKLRLAGTELSRRLGAVGSLT